MSTSYNISVGYNSGYSSDINPTKLLKEIIAGLTPKQILQEAEKCERISVRTHEPNITTVLAELAKAYSRVEVKNNKISFGAAGDNPRRSWSEAMCRALVRIILDKAHTQGVELNVKVT